jgi:hypothetical protein
LIDICHKTVLLNMHIYDEYDLKITP